MAVDMVNGPLGAGASGASFAAAAVPQSLSFVSSSGAAHTSGGFAPVNGVDGIDKGIEKAKDIDTKDKANISKEAEECEEDSKTSEKDKSFIDNEAMDNEIMQKILPRIQGSNTTVKEMLCELFKEIAGDYEGYQTESNNTADRMMDLLRKNESVRYPKSAEKIAFMVRRFEEDGFTSYWL